MNFLLKQKSGHSTNWHHHQHHTWNQFRLFFVRSFIRPLLQVSCYFSPFRYGCYKFACNLPKCVCVCVFVLCASNVNSLHCMDCVGLFVVYKSNLVAFSMGQCVNKQINYESDAHSWLFHMLNQSAFSFRLQEKKVNNDSNANWPKAKIFCAIALHQIIIIRHHGALHIHGWPFSLFQRCRALRCVPHRKLHDNRAGIFFGFATSLVRFSQIFFSFLVLFHFRPKITYFTSVLLSKIG